MATSVIGLACERRTNPLGIDVPRPRLSWQLAGERRGLRQQAYRITAAHQATTLDDGGALLWDSGRVGSDQSLDVAYGGPPLCSGQRVYWRVEVWDEAGAHVRSAVAWWELGLLDRADWSAGWIGAPFLGGPRTTSPAPFLRTSFDVAGAVVQARLYITALGLVEPWLNGAPVGADLFTPGWTEYSRRLQYAVYDVTAQLQPGANVLGAILGDGWYCGSLAWVGRQQYGDRPRLLAQLAIRYADGRTETIVTGPGWQGAPGPILESDFLLGESYDARLELGSWVAPGYAAAGWLPVELFAAPESELCARRGPPVRRQAELPSRSVHEMRGWPGSRWIFDLGQNLVGWARLRVSGPAGATVTLRFAEMLNPDGSLYTQNLRGARATDHYTLRGGGEECWEPRFTFHGFRYVELSGYPGVPELDAITGIVLHSDTPATGEFTCSNPLVNQLQQNIIWGQKGNFLDVPSDCPQRDERLGWTGDAQVFIRTAAFNCDVGGFFTKWLRDLADAQGADGRIPAVAPNLAGLPSEGGPAWADAAVICPWTLYRCYGDRRLLEEQYGTMVRFVAFLTATSRDGLRCYDEYEGWRGFGDWLALDGSTGREGGTSKELLGTAFYAHSARLLGWVAEALGRPDDGARYSTLFHEVRAAFQRRFVTEDGSLRAPTQTAYVLALHFELLPQELRPRAAEELARDIERRGNRLATGFVGTPYLPFVLTEAGRLDLAYALLLQEQWPSWLYSVTQGATTIWERWDGWTEDKGFQDPAMNSFNHYAYGAIGAWLYAVVAGIDVDPDQPGYKRSILRPQPGGGLTHARGALATPYGRLASAWRIEGERFVWEVEVPANSSATAFVPARADATVLEGDHPIGEALGVTLLRREGGHVALALEAGRYCFVSAIDPATPALMDR